MTGNSSFSSRSQASSERTPGQLAGGSSPVAGRLRHSRVHKLILTVVFLASLAISVGGSSSHLLADGKCGHPDLYGAAFVRPEDRLGEFKAKLKSPDYQDAVLTQRHYIALQLWGELVSQRLKTETGGACGALTNNSLFPNLWVYLFVGHAEDIEEDRRQCTQALLKILNSYSPAPDAVAKVAKAYAEIVSSMATDPPGMFFEADDVLKRSLLKIYRPGSVAHAFASVDASAIRTVAATSFFDWLSYQRSELVEFLQIPPCGSLSSIPAISQGLDEIPYSRVIPPDRLKISIGGIRDPSKRLLRRVLIVGLPTPDDSITGLNAPDTSAATKKYCNQTLSLAIGDDPAKTRDVKILCAREVLNRASWVVFFCDPKNCSVESEADAVLSAIAKDSAVLDLSKSDSPVGEPRGPYLIEIELVPHISPH